MALLIRSQEREALADLRARAEAAPVDMTTLTERMSTAEGRETHRAQMTEQSLSIPLDHLVTFSIETGHPGGIARHLSVSLERPGALPGHHAVWMIAEALGFVGGLEASDKVWPESLRGRVGQAINVLQFFATAEAFVGHRQ